MNNNYQQLKQKYKHWGDLSDLGKEEFGHIFPNGIVPLKILIRENVTLGGKEGVHGIYKVDVSLLTKTQYNLILEKLHHRSGFPINEMKKDFEKDGFIPMSSKYICTSGTNQIHIFM